MKRIPGTSLAAIVGLTALSAWLCPADAQAGGNEHLADITGVWLADFNHDSSRVIVQMRGGQIGIWDTESGEPVAADSITAGAVIGRGSYIMNHSATHALIELESGKSRLFELSSADAISPEIDITIGKTWSPNAFFDPTDTYIAAFDEDGRCRILALDTGVTTATLDLPAPAADREIRPRITFSDDGHTALVLDGQGTLHRYDTESWKQTGEPMHHPNPDAYHTGFSASADARLAVTSDWPGENGPSGYLQLWETATGQSLGESLSAQNGMGGRFFADGTRLLITPARGDTRVAALPTLETVLDLPRHDDVEASRALITADEKYILTWGSNSRITATSVEPGRPSSFSHGGAKVRSVHTGADPSDVWIVFDNSTFLLHGHYDFYVFRLDVEGMKPAASIRFTNYLHRAILSPDGTRLMIHEGRTGRERIRLFDAATLSERPVSSDHHNPLGR